MPLTPNVAKFIAAKRIINAHHEAGHAVAAVLRGGDVIHIALGDPTDDGLIDAEREMVARTRHASARPDWPFIAFAGLWAQWRIETERGDAEDLDLDEWLDTDRNCQLGEPDPFGDYAMMGYDDDDGIPVARIEGWQREIEPHWSAIVAVAAEVLAGHPVSTDTITAILANTLDGREQEMT
jgi:hypothetical protein